MDFVCVKGSSSDQVGSVYGSGMCMWLKQSTAFCQTKYFSRQEIWLKKFFRLQQFNFEVSLGFELVSKCDAEIFNI